MQIGSGLERPFNSAWRALSAAILATALWGACSSVALANITDTFTRPDAAALGNGWVEKNAGAFELFGGEAEKQAVSSSFGYRDNVVYRPSGENVLDVETTVQFRLTSSAPGYPQLFARVQTGTVGLANTLDGYMLYLPNSTTQAILGRQSGTAFVTTLVPLNLSSALNTAGTYRLRLRAQGTNPVALEAAVERLNGSNWEILSQETFNDTAPERIDTAGSVGFGGYVESSYTFDNFVRTNLSGTANPVPVMTGLAPASALAGESGLTLTVSGSNFVAGSIVRWNGANRTTTFVSANELEAVISPADLAVPASVSVTVFNPAPGGGTSNAQTFTVQDNPTSNPVPNAGALNPASATAGGPTFTLTVTGSAFASTAVVRWNGADRATTFISAGELRATIAAADIAAVGSASVRVFNPAPGGGQSGALTFTIQAAPNPAPTIGTINPASAVAGSAGFTLTVTGSSFVSSSLVRWNGSNRTTTFISSTELRATIPAADIASSGSAAVTVFTPTPGGGTSASRTFTIQPSGGGNNPLPVANSLSPLSVVTGSGSVQVTVTGSGFISSSQIRFNGAARTTTFLSSTQLRTTLSASDTAAAGLSAITVVTSAPGGGTSIPLDFFVASSGTQVFFDGFNRSDSAALGNNWTEKTASAFSLQNGEVTSIATTYDYHDAITYRPLAEDRRDVEMGIEFRRLPGNYNFPQLHARVQRNTIAMVDTLESYIFFVDDSVAAPGRAAIAVQAPIPDRLECYLAVVPFPSALVQGQRYRLRFRVTGVVPVSLTGIVDRWNGSSWEVFASGTTTHDNNTQPNPDLPCYATGAPIVSAGANGFSKWESVSDTYDNFYWMDAPGAPATPQITSLSPSNVLAGSGAFSLTVGGAGFQGNSVVRWNGAARTTTYVSGSQLQASISAADVAAAGNATVTVFNPAGGTVSAGQNFSISAPVGATFTDTFDRTDGPVIGNGWIEKSANAFVISQNQALKQGVTSGYRDNVVYRPASENLANAEAALEFRLSSANIGYPQVLTRVQTGTVTQADTLDGYIVYVNNSAGQAILGRQRGLFFVSPLATITLSAGLTIGPTYRMRVSANGINPVRVVGVVERRDGGAWTMIGQATVDDTEPDRITAPGSVGFGGYVETSYSFDNFTRTELF